MTRRAKYQRHPLLMLFDNKRLAHTPCMNLLQDLGLISDNCVHVEDVAHEDAMNVLRRVKAPWVQMFFR